MARKKRTPAKPLLFERYPVDNRVAHGADDRPISRGDTVRRIEYLSESMGVIISSRIGRVVDIYRRVEDGDIYVDFRGRDLDGQGLYSGRACQIKRSAANVEITYVPGNEEESDPGANCADEIK